MSQKFVDLPATSAPVYKMSKVERVEGAIVALGGVATVWEIAKVTGLERTQVHDAIHNSKATNVPTGIWRIEPVTREHHCPACGRQCAARSAATEPAP